MIAELLLAATPIVAPASPPPADFLAHAEEVRKAGATEAARTELLTVASIMAGTSVIEFPSDPGRSSRPSLCSCSAGGSGPSTSAWR